MEKPPHSQQQLLGGPVSLRSKKPAGPAGRFAGSGAAAAAAAAAAAQDRGVSCKSIVSLNNWTDFFGSSLDLTSEFETAAAGRASRAAEQLLQQQRSQCESAATAAAAVEGEEADDEEDGDEDDEEDLGDLLDPTDVVVLTNRQIIGRRASASLLGSGRQRSRPQLPQSASPAAQQEQPPQSSQKSFSPQHAAAQSASESFIASRGYQTLPARSKARQPPAPPTTQEAQQQLATAVEESAALNSSPSLPLSASQGSSSSLRLAARPPAMPASAMQGAGGSSCSLPVGSGPGGGFDGGGSANPAEPWQRVVAEIVSTEAAYVKDLAALVDGYISPMKQERQLFSEDTVQTVFSNLESLCEFHRGLLRRLERHQRSLRDFSQVFVDSLAGFQQYGAYCTNFPSSLAHLEEIQSQPEVRAYLSARQQALELSLPLQTYLLKPVQRILKYHLLLMSLQKSAPSGDADRHIKTALDGMTGIASDINEVQRRHEHALRVEELKSLLKSAHLDIGSLGELVREDSFRIHGHKGARQVFLFHKAILLTKRLQNGSLAIKEIIRCANLMLIESIPKEQLSFHILPFDNPKCQLTLQARRMDQKTQWCRDIKRLIIENYEATIPEKAKHIVLNMSELLHQNCNGASGAATVERQQQRSQSPPPSGRRRNRSSSGRREMLISSPERPAAAAGLRRGNSDEQLDVPAPGQRSRPVSRCYSSTEDLGDLLRYHEEALKEIFNRTTRCGSSSDSSAETDGEAAAGTSGGFLSGPDADFTSIAIEINEEVLGANSSATTAAIYGTSPRAASSVGGGGSGHRRQPSAGRGADILRAAIDKSAAVSAAVASAVSGGNGGSSGNGSCSKADSSPLYIHCPKGNYDTVQFGRAYERYIEKTKKKIALTETDIDEILRPLRQLRVDTGSGNGDGPGGGCGEGSPGNTPPSSADSSPRRIVSRIATSFGVGPAAATPTRIIQVSEQQQQQQQPAKQQRSQSVVSAVIGEIKSAWRKNSSANAAAAATPAAAAAAPASSAAVPAPSHLHLKRNDSASSDSGVFLPAQQKQQQQQQQQATRRARAPAPPAPAAPAAGGNGNGSNSGDGGSVQKFIRSFANKDAKAKHESDILNGAIAPSRRLPPGARPPPLTNSSTPAAASAASSAAARQPHSNGEQSQSAAAPTSAPVARRSATKSRKAPSPPPAASGQQPQSPLTAAHVLDSLPYADDDEANKSQHQQLHQQQQQQWRRTQDWSQENLYWKRALLDPPAKPPRPQGSGGGGFPGNRSGSRPPPPPPPSQSQSVAPLAVSEASGATAQAAPDGGDVDEEDRPRRGTVANLVNRFQHN